MDQESFRRILDTQAAGGSSSSGRTGVTSRGSLLTAATAKPKKKDAGAKPAFKPRKVAASSEDSKYRDRASERRHGEGNDFAHVEALLDGFEKQTKDAQNITEIEEKRKYLGGDGDHSILVKGLDFALLEQNRARAAIANDAIDDDSLEKAFHDVSADKPKKSRKELLQQLMETRAAGPGGHDGEETMVEKSVSAEDEARKLEEAKQKGRFKPIGFKPIGQSATEGGSSKKKKKKGKSDDNDGDRKKKKRKVETEEAMPTKEADIVSSAAPSEPPAPPELELEPIDDSFDIFADAGDYDGLELGDDDDDDDDDDTANRKQREPSKEVEDAAPRQWIAVEDSGPILQRKRSESPSSRQAESFLARPTNPHGEDVDMEDEETPMKLIPLASSALPDIKELLQMDRAATNSYKNKKRKDKKKAEPGGAESNTNKPSAEERAERDYKRLKAYTDKKAGK